MGFMYGYPQSEWFLPEIIFISHGPISTQFVVVPIVIFEPGPM